MNLSGYTIFLTYSLESKPYNDNSNKISYGYSQAIHCNYIQKITTDNLSNLFLTFYFKPTDFPFLLISGGTSGLGFTANKLSALYQIINRDAFTQENQVQPEIGQWRCQNLTPQTLNYVSGNTLTQANLVNIPYNILLTDYDTLPIYNLDYLNLPLLSDASTMNFGDEDGIFMGNVNTLAVTGSIFSTDISVQLPMNQYNTTTNKTWNPTTDNVIISEIGIYDDEQNLVGVAKLNSPLIKNHYIALDFVIGLDF